VLVQRFARIMATPIGVHVAVPPGEELRAGAAIEECLAWLREVDRRLSRFSAESELSRLNTAGGTWQPASEPLFAVVEQSIAAAEASGGLFDPTILPALEALGYDRDFKDIAYQDVAGVAGVAGVSPARDADEYSTARGSWREIELDHARRRVRMPPGVRLDFGGIAKGWAADVALDRCFSSLPDVLIDVGGDVRARGGAQEGEPWAIGIGDPLDPHDAHGEEGVDPAHARCAAVLTLGRGGLATSGATARWWRRGGEIQHHLLDPRTGKPARVWIAAGVDADRDADAPTADAADAGGTLIATATALAPTAALAEVAAKVALLRGYPEALRAVDADWRRARASGSDADPDTGADEASVALLLVLGSGHVACSEHMLDYLATVGGGGDLWLD
jgi:thiamine biosynthesis lipoprotein